MNNCLNTVYMLEHSYEKSCSCDEVKLIGVYSTKEKAIEAEKRYKKKEGFNKYPDGFSIDECVIDREEWEDGFVTIDW